MQIKLIISEQPKCKTCGELMKEWDPFSEYHEHIECSAKCTSKSLVDIVRKQLK